MQKEFLENFQKMTEVTLANFKKLGETNLLVGEKLLKEQAAFTNSLIKKSSLESEVPTDVDGFKDLTSKQAELAQENAKELVESCRSCADILTEAGKVYNDIFEKSLKSANEGSSTKPSSKSSKAA